MSKSSSSPSKEKYSIMSKGHSTKSLIKYPNEQVIEFSKMEKFKSKDDFKNHLKLA